MKFSEKIYIKLSDETVLILTEKEFKKIDLICESFDGIYPYTVLAKTKNGFLTKEIIEKLKNL